MKLKALLVIAMLALVVGFLFRRPPDTALDAADATAIERAAAIGATPLDPIREVAPTVDPRAAQTQAETSQVSVAGPTAPGSSGATLVFGRVLPPRGEETFAEAPACGLHDETGTRRKVECAEDGAFAIAGVAAGRYWLYAGDIEGATGCVAFELAAGVEQHEVNVTLERPWSVEVRVHTSDGIPPSDLWTLAVATLEPLGDRFEQPSLSSNPFGVGSFGYSQPATAAPGADVRGTLVIDVDAPVWVQLIHGDRVLARERISPPQSVVEFVVDLEDAATKRASLRGRFLDAETGEPLRSQQVTLTSNGATVRRTDENGRFSIEAGFAPGHCRVTLRSLGYAWDQLVRLEPGVETDLGDIRVERGLTLEGKVIGALGGERERTVRYEELDELSGELVWNGMLTVKRIEADGSFKIGALLPRRYQLTIDGGGDTARQRHVVDLRNGSVAGLEYVLQRASTLSIVLENPGRRLEKVEIHDESGALVMAPKLRPGPPQAFKLAPGSYTLKLGDVERQVVLGSEPLLVRLP